MGRTVKKSTDSDTLFVCFIDGTLCEIYIVIVTDYSICFMLQYFIWLNYLIIVGISRVCRFNTLGRMEQILIHS